MFNEVLASSSLLIYLISNMIVVLSGRVIFPAAASPALSIFWEKTLDAIHSAREWLLYVFMVFISLH
jgi:hypothetical protein